jgi:hypothetical protein
MMHAIKISRFRHHAVGALGSALLLACHAARPAELAQAQDAAALLRTDRVTYVLESKSGYPIVLEDTATVRFVNRHPFPVYFEVCGYKDQSVPAGVVGTQPISEIVRAGTDTTGTDFRRQWACVGAARLMVAPGAALQDRVWLTTLRDDGRPCPRGPGYCTPHPPRSHTTGWFQIEYRIYTGQRGDPAATLLPTESRRTNPFEVRWAR